MPEPTSRRGLLKALVRSAGETFGRDVSEAVEAVRAPFESAAAAAAAPPPPLRQAPAVFRSLSMDQLDDLVAEEGLTDRRDALHRLVRPATRLTLSPGTGPERSWIGRPPPPDDTVPAGEQHTAVAEINLEDVALGAGPLIGEGRLRLSAEPPGESAARCIRAEGSIVAEPASLRGRAVSLSSTELTLPRAWTAAVQALGLDEREHAAYTRLRARVAEEQGVTAEDGDAEGVAIHHLLGYPTDTSGTMPVVCELASRGLDPDTAPADVPQDVVAAAERWRLLLQMSQDEGSGVRLGAGIARLYLWIDGDAVERHDFSEIWAIAR